MSTTQLPAPVLAPAAPRTARAVLALTRVEAVRLLRHPVVLLALATVAVLWWWPWATGSAWRSSPVLHEQDQASAYPGLLVAFAALVAANRAVLRGHRHGTEELYGVRLVPRWGRTAAHLLALVPLVVPVGAATRRTHGGIGRGPCGSGPGEPR